MQLNGVLFNFGFKTLEAQEAFLENLYLAEYKVLQGYASL